MARSRKRGEKEVKMDMTPMIDCVFQLIIFFFLIIDLQNQDLERLVLPKAVHAVPDEPPDGFRPVINIRQDGTMIYKLKEYYNPENPDDYSRLKQLLIDFARKMKKQMDPGLKVLLPDEALLIRADVFTEMHHVAKVMENCGNQEILIWKVELAVGEPKDKKTGGAK